MPHKYEFEISRSNLFLLLVGMLIGLLLLFLMLFQDMYEYQAQRQRYNEYVRDHEQVIPENSPE